MLSGGVDTVMSIWHRVCGLLLSLVVLFALVLCRGKDRNVSVSVKTQTPLQSREGAATSSW